MEYAIKNLEVIKETEAVVPITHKELFFGFSVYESLKVVKGKVYFVDEHIDRLFNSAKVIGLKHHFTSAQVKKSFEDVVKANNVGNCLLRVQLLGGEEPTFFVFCVGITFYDKKQYRDGVKTVTYNGERYLPEAKSNCLLLNYVAFREAQEAGALDALLVDANGNIREGTRTNFFAVKDNTLITSGDDVLAGVTRKHILAVAEDLGFKTVFQKIPLKDVLEKKFDLVFISSTSMGAMPINQIDDVELEVKIPLAKDLNKKIKELYN